LLPTSPRLVVAMTDPVMGSHQNDLALYQILKIVTHRANVMAGLDPAVQTSAFRCWMPGSRPGMTLRVTIYEGLYYPYLASLCSLTRSSASVGVSTGRRVKPW
jgi:hypothetical protein